jgi:hypothetical protein
MSRFEAAANMAVGSSLSLMQETIWQARLPLEIRLAPSECRTFDKADVYLVSRFVSIKTTDGETKEPLDCMASNFIPTVASSPTACFLLAGFDC